MSKPNDGADPKQTVEHTRYYARHVTDDGSSICGYSGEAAGSDWTTSNNSSWAYCGECDQQVRVVPAAQ